MKSLAVLPLILCLTTGMIAAQRSAQITLRVVDEADKPLGGTSVTFTQWQRDDGRTIVLFEGKTDEQGTLSRRLPLPGDHSPGVGFRVEREGYFPLKGGFTPLPGGKHRKVVTLRKRHETTLRVREADGRPAAHRQISISGFWDAVFTDARGEVRFAHPTIEEAWVFGFRGEQFFFKADESDAIKEIRPAGLRYLPAPYQAGIDDANTPSASPPARVRGRLLHPDGSPARGWLVAGLVTRGGGWEMTHMPSTIHLTVNYRKLTTVDEEGRFELFPAYRDLVVVSPQGIPFHYPLSPHAWKGQGYLKNTTITLPKLGTLSLKLRWDTEDGEPAAGVELVPRDQGEFYDRWSFGPAAAGRGDVRFYLGKDFATEPGSGFKLPTSNDKGEITISVLPSRKISVHSWRALEISESWQPVSVSKKKDGDIVALKRSYNTPEDKKTREFNRFPLACTFTDSLGEPVDPQLVHWECFTFERPSKSSYAATGGFVENAQGHPTLYFGRTKNRIEFRYDNEKTGKTEYFTHKFKSEAGPPLLEVKFFSGRKTALSGKVLDHLGKPVPNIRLHLTRPGRGVGGKFTHIVEFSDATGAFRFDEAPWECGFYATASWEGHSVQLTELMDVPAINAANRKVELRLKPFGSVRVKIAGAKLLPRALSLRRKDQKWPFTLHPSRTDPHVFFSPFVPVGEYELTFLHQNKPTPLRDQLVVVRPDVETTLGTPAPPAMMMELKLLKRSSSPVRVTVRLDGKPAPGVLVRAMAGLDEKIVAAQTIDAEGGRHPVYAKSEIRNHVFRYAGDLTDNQGHAWLQDSHGGSLFVAAMDQEQRVAWGNFELPGEKELVLDLRPLEEILPKIPKPVLNPKGEAKEIQRAATLLGLY